MPLEERTVPYVEDLGTLAASDELDGFALGMSCVYGKNECRRYENVRQTAAQVMGQEVVR